MPRWHMPLDPDCPKVKLARESQANDPIWRMAGIDEEWWETFAFRHRPECKQCQEYGAENIDVV